MKLFPSTIIVYQQIDQVDHCINEILQTLGHKSLLNNPDVFIIDQNTNWTIEMIRSIKKFICQKPFCHQNKITIIFQAHNLNIESQNALLKTLEEPGENNYIFLTTNQPAKLLNTITSRCHSVKLVNSDDKKSSTEIIKISGDFTKDTLSLEKYYKNKEMILPFLKEQLVLFQKDITDNPNKKTSQNIQKIIKAITMIEANVDPRSALDLIFL